MLHIGSSVTPMHSTPERKQKGEYKKRVRDQKARRSARKAHPRNGGELRDLKQYLPPAR